MELPYLDRATALAPSPGKVLDVGCGSGEPLARYFIERGYEVTSVDAVEEMLDMGDSQRPRSLSRNSVAR
jgi:2-polyprenyl-3-methyl-5-hydroxy-6-metoxy-1,4-benzoquinol methylase